MDSLSTLRSKSRKETKSIKKTKGQIFKSKSKGYYPTPPPPHTKTNPPPPTKKKTKGY